MSNYSFTDYDRHPLLRTDKIDGVLTLFPIMAAQMELARHIPLVNINADKIQMDIEKTMVGGMTPASAIGSPAPIYGLHGRAYREFEAAEWKEKVILLEHELVDFRKLGTKNELMSARERLAQKYRHIEERLAYRLEYMRRQMIFDSTVTGVINGVEVDLATYNHPSYLEFTAGTAWSNTASADPVGDLQLAAETYMDYSGYEVAEVTLPFGTARKLVKNKEFRDIMVNSYGAYHNTQNNAMSMLAEHLGLGNVRESNAKLPHVTELTASAAAAQADITVRDTTFIAAGTTVVLKKIDGTSESKVVASVSGKTITFTENLVNAYVAGDMARWHLRTIPDNTVLMVGRPMAMNSLGSNEGLADQDKRVQWADVASTYSRYENLNNPRPGVFRKNIDKLGDDPPRLEQVIGIRALPRLHYGEGWATLDIG